VSGSSFRDKDISLGYVKNNRRVCWQNSRGKEKFIALISCKVSQHQPHLLLLNLVESPLGSTTYG